MRAVRELKGINKAACRQSGRMVPARWALSALGADTLAEQMWLLERVVGTSQWLKMSRLQSVWTSKCPDQGAVA
jgi:hypothetical protein